MSPPATDSKLNHSTPQPQLDPANKAHKETASSELWSTSLVGKPEEIANLLDSTKSDMVIWLGTETWLDTSICNTELFPSHCKLYMKDHNRGGGVLVAEREDIHGVEVAEMGTGCDCEVVGEASDQVPPMPACEMSTGPMFQMP